MNNIVGEYVAQLCRIDREKSACARLTLLLLTLSMTACGTFSGSSQPAASSQSVSSEDVFALSARAHTAYTQSRWIEAVKLYQRVVEHVPADADAWFRLGNTYAQQGAYERAIHAYETSLINESRQPKAWFNLSTAYLLNAQAAMRQSYDRMRSNDPARAMIDARLVALDRILHGRIEEASFSSTQFSR